MIYIVRQGETDWNLFKRANGVTDTFLNQTGIAQAKLQAENLRNVNFDACFAVPKHEHAKPAKLSTKDRLCLMTGSLK